MLNKISHPSFQIFSLVLFCWISEIWLVETNQCFYILASYWLIFLRHLNLKRGRFITSTATYSHLGFETLKARVVDGLFIKDKED